MQRLLHDSNGIWVKEYKHTRTNQYVSRQYLGESTFLVLTVNMSKNEDNTFTYTLNDIPLEDLTIYFGQHLSAYKHLEMYKKFYFDVDLSLNRALYYNSDDPISMDEETKILLLNGDTIYDYFSRNHMESVIESVNITPLESFYDLYLGYSQINQIVNNSIVIDDYEAVVTDYLSQIDESCFTWLKIVNNYFEDLPKKLKSKNMIIDYKIEVKAEKILSWLSSNFESSYDALCNSLQTGSLDFNFILYPPASTGMQFDDKPKILKPSPIQSTKSLNEIYVRIPKSLVENSQKYLEIIFKSVDTEDIIYIANTLQNPENFLIEYQGTQNLHEFSLQNSIFEVLSEVDFPTESFRLLYTLPLDVKTYLTSYTQYKIEVKVSDLTSERSF